ncbi:hypothetical protein ACTXJ5_13195 [Psychrobacter alimentarius]|uniref:hypothetical protein n=1 Tax=Psychrobacter alimentarius TaxID=261164 RepID=UPI003FD54EA2
MMQFKPFIFINRLIITKGKASTYDEEFHKGVNIIRGDNGSGKTTIMDFLFFSLGGNIVEKQWKLIALSCDNTYVEVNINNQVFVLNRQISSNSKESMKIFEGTYEQSLISSNNHWLSFPYASNPNKQSFHDNLLELLNIPVTKSENNSYINFNQILRLIYTDQLSNIGRIFREEDFDSNLKRETIGNLLLGINSKNITHKKLRIIQLEKTITKIVSDIKAFSVIYGEIESDESIVSKIENNKKIIEDLTNDIYSLENTDDNQESKDIITQKRNNLGELLERHKQLLKSINNLNFEIIDSEHFVENLINRLKNIEESDITLSILSDINFTYCPSCFNKICINSINENTCNLCDSSHIDDYEPPTYRIKKDIEFQIRETNELIPKFHQEYENLVDEYASLNVVIDNCRKELSAIEKPISGVTIKKTIQLIELGKFEQESIELEKKYNTLKKLYKTQNERDEVQASLNKLKEEVFSEENAFQSRLISRSNLISKIALRLIKKDLDREDGFKRPTEITFNFANDRIRVDGISNFSASSTAFLKTILKLSILIASCEESGFLYPRLAIIDNVEDKGMEEERSQNLQRIIVEESKKLNVEHQIIFTTSKIDPSLDNTAYCVGDYYNYENKTLKLLTN